MKILIISENFRTGGLETQVIGFVKHLVKAGHEVYLISGLNSRTALLKGLIGEANIFEVDMNPYLSTTAFSEPLYKIISYIKEIDPDVIHLHPFTSLIYGGLASAYLEKPYVVTLHGPASVSSWGSVYRIFLEIILKDAFKVFCVSREVYEKAKAIIEGANLVLLPNGVDAERFKPAQVDPSGPIALISRLDSDKLPGIKAFLNLWSKLSTQERNFVHIFGDGFSAEELKEWVKDELKGESWIRFMGHRDDLDEALKTGYSAVAGMGRVILEALAMEIPAILVGYDGVKGVVTLDKVDDFAERNFSGRYTPNVDIEELLEGMKKALRERALLRDWVKKKADEGKIVERYLEELRNLPEEKEYFWKEPLFSAILDAEDAAIFGDKVFFNLVRNFSLGKELSNWINLHLIEKLALSEAEKHRIMKEKEELLQNLNESLKQTEELKAQNEELRGERDSFLVKLNEIYNSNAWKLVRAYYRLVENTPFRYLHRIYKPALNKIFRKPYSLGSASTGEAKENSKIERVLKFFETSEKSLVMLSSMPFDITYNQRPLNLSKQFSKLGFKVLFVVWQWSPDEIIPASYEEVYPNIFQIPMYDFLSFYQELYFNSKEKVFYVSFPVETFIPAMREMRKKGFKIVYDIMDDWEGFAEVGQAPWYKKEAEERIILEADFVVAILKSLAEKFAYLRKDIFILPNAYDEEVVGVDAKFIAGTNANDELVTIGYYGWLSEGCFDWDFVFNVAKAYEGKIKIQLIGYALSDENRNKLMEFENIEYIGKVSPRELKQYVSCWHIGIIPFKEAEIAKGADPLKLYEYIYFGLPTFIKGIDRELANRPLVFYVGSVEQFGSMLEKFDSKEKVKEFQQANKELVENFLIRNNWKARAEELINIINKPSIWS